MFAVVLSFFVAIHENPYDFENKLNKVFFVPEGFINSIAQIVQQAGGVVAIAIVTIILGLYLFSKKTPLTRILVVISFPLAVYLVVATLKYFVDRERPTVGIASSGFPSLHAAFSITYIYFLYAISRKTISWLLLLVPFMIAVSRLITGAHYLLDVIGGLLIGAIFYAIYTASSFSTAEKK